MVAAPKQSADKVLVKRLHIGGLTNPKITHLDLEKRFSSFGTVGGVEGVGIDANGDPRTYAYLSLTTTQPQLSRCLSLLSGATWKGSLLKIGEAKQHYAVRLEAEREALKRPLDEDNASTGSKKRKKLKLGRGVKGIEAKNMDLVEIDNVEGRKNWHLTPLSHLIRPLILRPTHPVPAPTLPLPIPLPAPPAPLSKAAKKAGKLPKPAPPLKKKKTGKGGLKSSAPPVRSRLIVIDPRRYERTHFGAGMLDSGDVKEERGWICVDAEGGQEGVVKWIREGPNGEELGVEEVLVGKKRVDEVLKVLSGLQKPETGGSSKPAQESEEQVDEDEDMEFEPLDFDNDDAPEEDDWIPLNPTGETFVSSDSLFSKADDSLPISQAGPSSPLFATRKVPAPKPAPTSALATASLASTLKPTLAAKAAPPPPPVKASKSKAPPPPSEPAVDPLESAFLEEKARGLDVLKGLFGGGWSPEPDLPPSKVEALPGGIVYHSDDDEEDDDTPMVAQSPVVLEDVEEVPAVVEEKLKPVAVAFPEKKSVSFIGVPEVEEMEVEEEAVEEEEDEKGSEEEMDPIELAMRELRGWGESSEEEEEVVEEPAAAEDEPGVLRLRGGAGSDDSHSDSDEEGSSDEEEGSSSSSSTSEDEDEVAPAPVVAEVAAPASPPPAKKAKKFNALKDMFAPQSDEGTSFSLLSSLPLDLDLDPSSDPTLFATLPLPPNTLSSSYPTAGPSTTALQLASHTTTSLTATFKSDASVPYFFPFLHLSDAERAKGPKQQAKSVLEIEREKEGGGVEGFWRTNTGEEMQARWDQNHLELTREYKKRHREAVKRRRRRGAVDGEEDGEGNAVGDM